MIITGKYPKLRLRRSRKYDWSRRLMEENNLTSNDFILPIFLIDGKNKKESIKSMPAIFRYTIDKLPSIIDRAIKYKSDVIVSGTGAVGSAATYYLARKGVDVIGLDRFPAAHDKGSSHGQTRIIRLADFEHPNYVPLLERSFELWDQNFPT